MRCSTRIVRISETCPLVDFQRNSNASNWNASSAVSTARVRSAGPNGCELVGEVIEERSTQHEPTRLELLTDDRFALGGPLGSPGDGRQLLVHLEPVVDEAIDSLLERADADVVELDLGNDTSHGVRHGGAHQVVTMVEISIDRPVRHPGALGDRIDRGVDVAFFEDLDHRIEHGVAILALRNVRPSVLPVCGVPPITRILSPREHAS